uniref:WRKY19-like zinc finger domain-containing protein n=1 Tax=Timema monikensis TaxID=170555 RepID=A0A7R9EID7_9NEOP|nr:unnamed protein product [Timema monikensis]
MLVKNGISCFPLKSFSICSSSRMDERTLPVKIEPEEDLEYDHHHEVCIEIESDAKPSLDTKDNICNEIQSNTAMPFEYVDVPVIKQEFEGPLKDGLNAQTTLTSSTSSSQQLPRGTQAKCKEEGCVKFAQGGGFCMKHGGIQAKCKEECCTKYAQGGGFCIKHGGTHTKCKEESCTKYALGGGFCMKHGGTRTKCKDKDCTKNALGGGFCMEHGGTRAKCKEKNCTKYTLGGGFCMKHGGTRAKCKEKGCTKWARGGGFCMKHGGTKFNCKEEACTKMDERSLPPKIKSEENVEYPFHQEVCLELEIDAKPSVDTKDSICDEIHSITALPFEYVDVPIIKQEVETGFEGVISLLERFDIDMLKQCTSTLHGRYAQNAELSCAVLSPAKTFYLYQTSIASVKQSPSCIVRMRNIRWLMHMRNYTWSGFESLHRYQKTRQDELVLSGHVSLDSDYNMSPAMVQAIPDSFIDLSKFRLLSTVRWVPWREHLDHR